MSDVSEGRAKISSVCGPEPVSDVSEEGADSDVGYINLNYICILLCPPMYSYNCILLCPTEGCSYNL